MKIEEFNLTSSKQLFDICQKVIQMKSMIETMYVNMNMPSMADLPPSMVPTEMLYETLVGFTVLFDKCLANDLIKSGSKLQYKNRMQ